jgi:hypothetical protein
MFDPPEHNPLSKPDDAELRRQLDIVTQDELAATLQVTKGTLREWRRQGKGPDFVRIGKAIFYRVKDVQEYIAMNLVPTVRG